MHLILGVQVVREQTGSEATITAGHQRQANQLTLVDSIRDFFDAFQTAPGTTPHCVDAVMEKDQGRFEVRRCYAFDQLECIYAPGRWPELRSFAVTASARTIKGKIALEHRFYISSLPADAVRLVVLRHIDLNLIRLAPVQRKAGIKVRRLIASTSDSYRAQLLGLV